MKRILIVDDNDDNLYFLSAMLKGNGYEVEEARNGSEALVKALAREQDMIISDILMPVIDGFTLCRIVKNDDRLKRVPFIFYTATYTDPRDEKLALRMGADAFIVKPVEPEEFMGRIEGVLGTVTSGAEAARGESSRGEEEAVVLKEYNEALIRKLEKKMLDLEHANRALEAEIEARRRAGEALQAAVQEKEALLKEIHHRVKNNMQVISSMINLQLNDGITSMTTAEILLIARELQHRIRSMALVHEMLYKSKSLSKINFNEYLHNLLESLFIAYHVDSASIATEIRVTDEPLTITTAIPIGQIVNELLTNAIKYAFPSGRKGEIRIEMTVGEEGTFDLTVRDSGVGLPEPFDIDSQHTFGMRLISLLITQIGGSIQCRNDSGAVFAIRFRDDPANGAS